MSRADRARAAEIQRQSDMLGLPPYTIARWLAAEQAGLAAEERQREAERAAAVERAEQAAWIHQRENLELGLPPGATMAERLRLRNPLGDEPSRNPAAPLGSVDRPARFVSTAGGGLTAIDGYSGGPAERGFTGSHDAALARRAAELSSDPFMKLEIARFRSRRKVAARAAAQRAAAASRTRRESGTGWPQDELTRVTAGAFSAY